MCEQISTPLELFFYLDQNESCPFLTGNPSDDVHHLLRFAKLKNGHLSLYYIYKNIYAYELRAHASYE